MAKNKMPPELLEHFKKKAAKKEGKDIETDENKKESDNSRRKEALKKARSKIEEKNSKHRDKQKEAGQERS
jgi:hypothetical protein